MDLSRYVVLKKGLNVGFSQACFKSIGEGMKLFESQANILVCPTNGKGTMAHGWAKQFNERFPGLKTAYANATRHGQQESGMVWFWQAPDSTLIACFTTQPPFEERSHIGDAFAGIYTLSCIQREFGLSIAMPIVGCEMADLDEGIVKKFILETMDMTKTEVCHE